VGATEPAPGHHGETWCANAVVFRHHFRQ
jgi:hypothetical protein